MQKEALSVSMAKSVMVVSLIVGIGAVFGMLGYFWTMPKSEVVINNVIEKEEINKDDAADLSSEALAKEDWKTYRNEEYRFEFKYPDNFTIEEPVSDVAIVKSGGKEYLQVQYFYLISTPPKPENYMPNSASFIGTVNIGNKKADKYYTVKPQGEGGVIENTPYTNYVITLGDKEWIQIDYYGEKEIASSFEKILSTFKFIEKVCPSTVTDIDGNTYNTVKIGTQCWLKENLKVTKNPQGKAITRYCYDNDPKICETDGGLYDWNTAMNNSTQEGAQGICPSGTHIPTDAEQYILENFLKDSRQTCSSARSAVWDCATAGTKIKVGGTSGFEGILAGYRYPDRSFLSRGTIAHFWSSTESGAIAWNRGLSQDLAKAYRFTFNKDYGFSIRCLKEVKVPEEKVEEVVPEEITEDEIDDTADWKTYRNEEYGFEVKYPESWNYKKENMPEIVSIIPPESENNKEVLLNGINVLYNTKTLKEILDEEVLADPYSVPQKFKKFIDLHPDIKDIKINDMDGKQYETELKWIGGSQNIIISMLPTNKGTLEVRTDKKYELIYNQILSTFKFTK